MSDPIEVPSWAADARIARLLADVHIASPASFRIGAGPDIPVRGAAASTGTSPPPDDAALANELGRELGTALYAAAYMRVYRAPGHDPAPSKRALAPDPAFVARLDARNPSRAAWEPGWRVFSRDLDGAVHAAKGDNAVRLLPGRFALHGAPRAATVGDAVERWRERSSLVHQPGYYYAFGEAPPNDYDQARISRLYFDAAPDAAEWLVGDVLQLLNRFGVPFWFKCPVDPAAYDRLDAAVLYVARRHIPTVFGLLAPLAADFDRRLRGGVPLWTLPLFPGVGAADDPGTGESFGQSRCALFASGLVDAFAQGRQDPAARAVAVGARFRAAGLAAAEPHLAMGLADIYRACAELDVAA